MAQDFDETSQFRINQEKYNAGYVHVFGDKKEKCRECKKELTKEEAKSSWYCKEHDEKL